MTRTVQQTSQSAERLRRMKDDAFIESVHRARSNHDIAVTPINLAYSCIELGFRAYADPPMRSAVLYAHRPWWVSRARLGPSIATVKIGGCGGMHIFIYDPAHERRLLEVADVLSRLYGMAVSVAIQEGR